MVCLAVLQPQSQHRVAIAHQKCTGARTIAQLQNLISNLINNRQDGKLLEGWWALQDLNQGPFGCKPNALTAELSALAVHPTRPLQERQRTARGSHSPVSFLNRSAKSDTLMLRLRQHDVLMRVRGLRH
jgi:hypothetical protein